MAPREHPVRRFTFAQGVAADGDFNGDGLPDLAFGAPYADGPVGEEGVAYLVYGQGEL